MKENKNVWKFLLIATAFLMILTAFFWLTGKPQSAGSFLITGAAYLLIILLKNCITLFTAGISLQEMGIRFGKDILWFTLLPILGAFLFKYFEKGNQEWLNKSLAFISMLGIGIIITIITAAGRDSLLDVGLLLILACFIHNMSGYGLGYVISKYILRMPESDYRTIALEVGMQNGGLASGLAMQMGKIATVGLAPPVFGPMMNITGSSLATWWRGKPPKEMNDGVIAG